jgi:hypothetical protein
VNWLASRLPRLDFVVSARLRRWDPVGVRADRPGLPLYWSCFAQRFYPEGDPPMADLAFIILTGAVFGLLGLLVRGLERL